ncbi:FAD-dependent oxidoreductase [Novosphingobium sp. BL-52-GroH]|uniref:FAD-dependent oxidoreductase n=1 Tax=Novosphingobium sp. BL-52-GroH TaxID=3349877 RepID=UPI00384B1C27
MALKKVLVVGGGIGGLSAAIALSRRGIAVDLVEINTKFTVYHVGIIVQANLIRAMKELGLANKLVAAGFPYRGVEMCDADGKCLKHVQGPRIAGDEYPSDLGMGRPALHKVLTEAVHETTTDIRLGVTFTEIDQRGDHVHVTFTDGTERDYDVVLGCDGVYSKVRASVFGPQYKPEFTGQGVWRYNVPRPEGLDVAALYSGDGGKAGFVPLTPDTMYILMVREEKGNPQMPPERLAELFRERLAGFGGYVGEARDKYITDSSQVVYRPLEALLMPAPWYRGRVLLMGDSAHATTPHMGQGAAQAVEDAVVFAELAMTDLPVEDMLNQFMERRYERCKFIWEASIQVGNWEMTRDPAADHASLRVKMLETVAAPL